VNCAAGAAEAGGMELIVTKNNTTNPKPARQKGIIFLNMCKIILELPIA
jgi:hypothetical protein